MFKTILKFTLFTVLLLTVNLYLLKEGVWLFQDASGLPKNATEAYQLFLSPFFLLSNDFYYSYNQGLLTYLNIIATTTNFALVYLLGPSVGQIWLFVLGYILAFLSFYLFAGLFFKKELVRYALSLIFTFNPLVFNLQGIIIIYAAIPLYLYSFYRYYFDDSKIRFVYLLINLVSVYLWISYVRLFQANLFVIAPYVIYFLVGHKRLYPKKIFLLLFFYAVVLLPFIYTALSQIFEKSSIAFNYGSAFKKITELTYLTNAFNPFTSFNLNLYEHRLWPAMGICFYIYFLYLLITYTKKHYRLLLSVSLLIIVFGITCYGLGTIFGEIAYLYLLSVLPFVTNGAYWALYITVVPTLVVLGIVTQDRPIRLIIYTSFFAILAVSPFLFVSDFHFQKFNLSELPKQYYEYFTKPYKGIPEATLYVPRTCWRAKYMDISHVPTQCFNLSNQYAPVNYDNQRFLFGDISSFSQKLYGNTDIDNLRIIMNLKHIIVATDIIHERDKQGKTIDQSEAINSSKTAKTIFDSNNLLSSNKNESFMHYYFTDKNHYDFFIYSPKAVVNKDFNNALDDSLDVNSRPVVFESGYSLPSNLQGPTIYYKQSPENSTFYPMRISNIVGAEKFILQFNQTYNKDWKIKQVNKEYFESITCSDDWKSFKITNNFRCQYENALVYIKNISLLTKPELAATEPLKGNLIGNAWIIDPRQLPIDQDGGEDLYAVIIFEKQLWYTITILIAGGGILAISSLALWQIILRLVKKDKYE